MRESRSKGRGHPTQVFKRKAKSFLRLENGEANFLTRVATFSPQYCSMMMTFYLANWTEISYITQSHFLFLELSYDD